MDKLKYWDIADEAIEQAYPGWNHVPNRGILRGAIVRAIRTASQQAATQPTGEKDAGG